MQNFGHLNVQYTNLQSSDSDFIPTITKKSTSEVAKTYKVFQDMMKINQLRPNSFMIGKDKFKELQVLEI